jgi:hypothetical protein
MKRLEQPERFELGLTLSFDLLQSLRGRTNLCVGGMAWFALSFFIAAGSLELPGADAGIVVGVSTMNVSFLPVYLTQNKGYSKTRD